MRISTTVAALLTTVVVGGAGTGILLTNASAQAPVSDIDCNAFDTQAQAIQYFKDKGYSANNDPENLDENNNGVPCESLPTGAQAPSSSPVPTEIVQEPEDPNVDPDSVNQK